MKRNLVNLTLLYSMFAFCCEHKVPHKTETITFQADRFRIVGELRLPQNADQHPLVIMVHGDGPAYRNYFSTIKKSILKAGYATLMWDKPGYGESKGELSKSHFLHERAEILVEAIRQMKAHPAIDTERIGVWGISQAGYVIPLALLKTDDISFMVMVGCPGEDGINQTGYLIRRQLEFAGVTEVEAREAEDHFIKLFYAETFEQYLSHAKPLYDNPVQRKLGFVSALWDQENWQPHHPDEESFFNPIDIIETVSIPVLVFFGEKDTQVDPVQGVEAFQNALKKANNPNYRIELIPNADHNIILSETGSMKERSKRSRKGWRNYAPEYLRIMEEWLKKLGHE